MSLYAQQAADLARIHADAVCSPSILVGHINQAASPVTTSNIPARFDRLDQDMPDFSDGRMKTRLGTLTIRVADLAAVAIDDSFLITPIGGGDAETWKVTGIPLENPAFRKIDVLCTGARRFITAQNEHNRGGKGN